ncbi:MAG TPA: NADH-ubiquinone oxidoreductase-F iron-sulfur binding region domain-containing protein [Candidatus Binataceae bacterium]|nr:NADH-ubiquinone oxidoreductase-F iron-sulfur binding region domain-containing protein [Candidatus Binataceae bacterium]
MSVELFIPRDSGAVSVGAEAVARAIAQQAERRNLEVQIVRNGSRGAYAFEPMVEAATPAGRIAYGPVTAPDVPELFDAGILAGGAHRLRLGIADQIPFLAAQNRLTFARAGVIDPLSIDDYLAHGGFQALPRALEMGPARIVEAIKSSGLRGRGGAGFPAGIKWETARGAAADRKFIVCNADEGDSGTFADRMILEGDPFALIEAMAIAAAATGASFGYIYIRSEYPDACRTVNAAIAAARDRGFLGRGAVGAGHDFELEVRVGAGSYVCGEETAMLESIEGRRGMVRAKPPVPAISGLFGKPTLVHNVVTLASVPVIIERGADFYRALGTASSSGTLPFQLAGNVKRPGLVELPLGATLRELVIGIGEGTASGRPIRAIQIGGPLGAYLPASALDTPLDYESMQGVGGILGHGGIVVFDDTVDMARMARFAMEFCALESCGKCTPCRIGSVRGVEVIDKIIARRDARTNLMLLRDLCDTMTNGSLCALGGLAPLPVLSAVRHFPADFGLTIREAAEL